MAERMYMQPRIVGAPSGKSRLGGGPPPKFIFKLLFLLHPELRYRKKQAEQVFATRRWRQDLEHWRKVEAPRQRQRNLELQMIEPDSLDDAALRKYLKEVNQNFYEGMKRHFRLIPACNIAVGDWLVQTQKWTGATPGEVLEVLKGASAASVETVELLDQLAQAVQKVAAAREIVLKGQGPAPTHLEALRATSPEVKAMLDHYLAEHGLRIVTGLTFADLTLVEMPQILLNSIAARLNQTQPAKNQLDKTDSLRERVPAVHRAEYDNLLQEARLVYGLRDENVGLGGTWPSGLVRRAIMAAGRRLTERGDICQAEHVLEASPEELDSLLGGPGTGPSQSKLAERAAERQRLEQAEVPAHLGQLGSPPPPAEFFPAAVARLNRASLAYQELMAEAEVKKAPVSPDVVTLQGQGVSAGCYEGRARVVNSPSDFEKIEQGAVLVTRTTSPAYNVLLPLLGAIVTDRGGTLCHAAIVAREFGIPGVVGTREATRLILDGARVVVDGSTGRVELVD